MAAQIYDNSYRTTYICVDSYDEKIPRGRLYNSFFESGIEFVGVMDFILNMERIFDEINSPQDFASKRSFKTNIEKIAQVYTDDNIKVGKLATFSVRLLFRQNASWQGAVTWREGKSEESFRSALELFLLMDSALSSSSAETQ
ncbi:MAG: hypothetical protein E7477_01045 [Ruminococcaceae bacterium]|nr:hypothetical protein [Oscillospiraceae bacterium]